MIHGIVIIFLISATLFAAAHAFAVAASLYWYYWWFDVVMHFWGGILITMGLYSLATFSRFTFKPNLTVLLGVLLFVTLLWEAFEFVAGLWQPETYVTDTLQDIILGFGGGLLAYVFLRNYRIE